MPEYRKLIGFGKSSLVISLPKDWIVKNKLKKGDVISLNVQTDQLIVNPQDKPIESVEKIATIRTEHKELEKIRAEIVAAYLTGNNIIEVRGENLKEHAQEVKNILQNFAGIELMEQDARKIVAKDLIDLSELSIDTIIRRIDIILRSMFQDSLAKEDNTESIFLRDKDVNRLVYLIRRVIRLAIEDHRIAKRLKCTNLDLLKQKEMVRWMELAGDQIKRLNRMFDELPKKYKNRGQLDEMLKKLETLYLDTMKSYHTKNIEKAYDINLYQEKLREEIKGLSKTNTVYPASRIVQKLLNLSHNIKNMARVVIC